jgi:hypothetical protein
LATALARRTSAFMRWISAMRCTSSRTAFTSARIRFSFAYARSGQNKNK